MSVRTLDFFKSYLSKHQLKVPSFHFVLGSGLGKAFEDNCQQKAFKEVAGLAFADIPDFSNTTVEGHKGEFRSFVHEKSGAHLLVQMGRIHGYEGHDPGEVVQPLMLTRELGTEKYLLSNAAGSVKRIFKPGHVMIIKDHVNFTGKNPLVGKNPKFHSGTERGPRFPDMSRAWDEKLNAALKKAFVKSKVHTHEGIYTGVLGPSFETPAEINFYSKAGFGSVGMSTVWEAIALRHTGAQICGFSVISNFGAGLVKGQTLTHEEVQETVDKVAVKIVKGLFDFASSCI